MPEKAKNIDQSSYMEKQGAQLGPPLKPSRIEESLQPKKESDKANALRRGPIKAGLDSVQFPQICV